MWLPDHIQGPQPNGAANRGVGMTIGIAIRGPRAGLAAIATLRSVELLGRGAIGGFCVFAFRDPDGEFHYATTQDGGTAGLDLPNGWDQTDLAALISSGPNRPEPLTQFLPTRTDVGLVTGHRLPNSRLSDGIPINQRALELMGQNVLDNTTLQQLVDQAPAMDAGLICLPPTGPCLIANSPRVTGRDDVGRYIFHQHDHACAILHNSIYSACLKGDALAAVLGAIGLEQMGIGQAALGFATLPDQVKVVPGYEEYVQIDDTGRVLAIYSADPAYAEARPRITAIYSRVPILRDGKRIGWAATEVFARVADLTLYPDDANRRFLYWRE